MAPTQARTRTFEDGVADRFGVLPNFFRQASADPEITQNLWGFALFAYLDNPMPSLFKERLFVYLSKFCPVRYCIARHLGFLLGLGRPAGDATCAPQTIEGVLPLLRRPLIRGDELVRLTAICSEPSTETFPQPDSAEEGAVFACATHVFLQAADAPQAHAALARRFGSSNLERLNVFLAFVRTAHYWTRLHPELTLEPDISKLLSTHETLADLVLIPHPTLSDVPNELGFDEWASIQRFEKLRELMTAIVESSDDAIISKDLNGIIQSWNNSAERLFGFAADEVIGKPITILIPEDRLSEEATILASLQRGQRVDHFETIRRHKNGALLNISLTISPVKDAHGKIIGASKVARDITDRKRQEQALQAANAALKRSNVDLEHFAYSASHDLQEPLRMISAYSEMLQQKFGATIGADGQELIGFIMGGAQRMENLLRDLRAFTQAALGSDQPAQSVDANAALRRCLDNLKSAIDDSGANITCGDLPSVAIHECQLEQLFQNLISNAIRYRSPAVPEIHVDGTSSDTNHTLWVRDNGIGVESQYQEQIFGIFKRLHTAAEYPGNGMGLAICERIVERAGGRIWVESAPGRGSTFYFTVPKRG
jgi:PAS domain S-box-containing protein